MRKDEEGNPCPETLGEYRDICAALAGEDNAAVKFLDGKIADQGRGAKVLVSDHQMRMLLFPLLIRKGAS